MTIRFYVVSLFAVVTLSACLGSPGSSPRLPAVAEKSVAMSAPLAVNGNSYSVTTIRPPSGYNAAYPSWLDSRGDIVLTAQGRAANGHELPHSCFVWDGSFTNIAPQYKYCLTFGGNGAGYVVGYLQLPDSKPFVYDGSSIQTLPNPNLVPSYINSRSIIVGYTFANEQFQSRLVYNGKTKAYGPSLPFGLLETRVNNDGYTANYVGNECSISLTFYKLAAPNVVTQLNDEAPDFYGGCPETTADPPLLGPNNADEVAYISTLPNSPIVLWNVKTHSETIVGTYGIPIALNDNNDVLIRTPFNAIWLYKPSTGALDISSQLPASALGCLVTQGLPPGSYTGPFMNLRGQIACDYTTEYPFGEILLIKPKSGT